MDALVRSLEKRWLRASAMGWSRLILKDDDGGVSCAGPGAIHNRRRSFVACRLIVYQQFRRTTSKRCMYANASTRRGPLLFPRDLGGSTGIVRANAARPRGRRCQRTLFFVAACLVVSPLPELLSVIESYRWPGERSRERTLPRYRSSRLVAYLRIGFARRSEERPEERLGTRLFLAIAGRW